MAPLVESSSIKKYFPRDLSALESLFAFIAEFRAKHGVRGQDAREVELIIEELFTNFVRHNDGQHEISVELATVDETICIRITDEDVDEFDLTQVPEPDPERPLEDRRAGGMGILLVRKLSQKVSYDYHDRTSTVTILKRLTARE